MKVVFAPIVVFLLLSLFMFSRYPGVSGRTDFRYPVVGIKMQDGKVLPVFPADEKLVYLAFAYVPDSLLLKLKNFLFPITVRSYESFVVEVVYFPFSFSVYTFFVFNIAVGVILIVLSFALSRDLLASFLTALFAASFSHLIDKNSYYIASVFVLLVLKTFFQENGSSPRHLELLLLITTLVNVKVGFALVFSALLTSLVLRKRSPFKLMSYFLIGVLPFVFSYLMLHKIYRSSYYFLVPPDYRFFVLWFPDFSDLGELRGDNLVNLLSNALLFFLFVVAYFLTYLKGGRRERLFVFSVGFVVFQFLGETLFHSHEHFRFIPSYILSVLVLARAIRCTKNPVFAFASVLLFASFYYKAVVQDFKRGYYPYKVIKDVVNYLVSGGYRKVSVLCDLPISRLVPPDVNLVDWHYVWNFLREREKHIDKDERIFQALVLKMNRGRYVIIDLRADDYSEVSMTGIRHLVSIKSMKQFPEEKPFLMVAYVDERS